MFGSGSTVHVVELFIKHCSQNTVHTPRFKFVIARY
ncbi:hypothetical protein SLEP1_g35657 [Rubroshorea leprosula]|uniref:Uncharacterized protein n=1 Tax=Rubroshorea leprosula TaxID=152421 RepID=A0AAV5KNZ7_9ROSI|nr:hypothetical protein SLEP1_g35657 [Rubroshorea leprosula]